MLMTDFKNIGEALEPKLLHFCSMLNFLNTLHPISLLLKHRQHVRLVLHLHGNLEENILKIQIVTSFDACSDLTFKFWQIKSHLKNWF